VIKRKSRGFTLAEMLVYMAVLSVFTTALYSVFLLSTRHFKVSEARNNSAQSSLLAVGIINRLLVGGNKASLQVQTSGPPAMMFLSALQDASTGNPSGVFQVNPTTSELLYPRWMCIHFDSATSTVKMTTIRYVGTGVVGPTVVPTFATMTGNSLTIAANLLTAPLVDTSMTRRVIARNIPEMTFSPGLPGQVVYTIRTTENVAITTRTAQKGSGVVTSGTFTLRN
jgi:prepilin-type N-terminal cleavage/methylation domain-containing protein